MSARAPRGQNLVLLALAMLFLALMVTMTIGLGLRVRQRHEVQNVADAAAYSNAVMTARAFNNMATINRLEVSYWVALAADQSLISWSGFAQGLANGASTAAKQVQNSCGNAQDRQKAADFHDALETYINQKFEGAAAAEKWRNLDQAAGAESLAIQGTIGMLRDELSSGLSPGMPGNVQERLFDAVRAQQITTQILARSGRDDLKLIPGDGPAGRHSAPGVSMQEIDCDIGGGNGQFTGAEPANSGLCMRSSWGENLLQAAMGSRLNSFVSGRSDVPPTVKGDLLDLGNSGDVSITMSGGGSAYWAALKDHGANPNRRESWGDDHGDVTITIGSCSATFHAEAWVRSTHLDETGDQHYWTKRESSLEPEQFVHHTMGDCTPLCPSVWVRTVGFQPDGNEDNAWGQPKTVVAIERDLEKHQYPWELHFKFPFSAGPAGAWDGRGLELTSEAGHHLSVRRQTAVSTGIVYYHRAHYWREFPNLLNPFWRATLAPVDVDGARATRHSNPAPDVPRVLGEPQYRWQIDAYKALVGAGYEGLH